MPYDVVAFTTDEHAMMLTLDEEGAFHRLLRHSWVNGGIPDDMTQIAKICRAVSMNQMRKLWPALAPLWPTDPCDSKRRVNPKQESERDFKQEKSGKAKESAAKRWQKEREAKAVQASNANAMRTHTEGNAPLPSPPRPIPSHKESVLETYVLPDTSSVLETAPDDHKPAVPDSDFQKFWGPVEGYLRREVVDDSFQKFYAGIRVLDMNSRLVVLAVPDALITRNTGSDEITATVLRVAIEKSGKDFLRNRGLKVVRLSEVAKFETAGKESR